MGIPDKAWTSLCWRHLTWRQREGGVGQNCSLHMKTYRITGTQIVADDHDGQKGKAQAGAAREWGFLFPVKLKEFVHDFAKCVSRSR